MKNHSLYILLASICFCLSAVGADASWPKNIRELSVEVERVQTTNNHKAMLLLTQFLPKCKPHSDDNLGKTVDLFDKVLAKPLDAQARALNSPAVDFDVQALAGSTIKYLHGARLTDLEVVIYTYLEKVSPLVNWSERDTAMAFLEVLGKMKLDAPRMDAFLRKVVSAQAPTHPEGRMALMLVATHPAAREMVWDHLAVPLSDPQAEGSISQLLMSNPQVMKGHANDVAALLLERIKVSRENHAFKSGLVPLLLAVCQPGDLNASANELLTLLKDSKVAYPIKVILASLIVMGVNDDNDLAELNRIRASLLTEAIQWRAKFGREQKSTCLAHLLDLPMLLLFPGQEAPAFKVSNHEMELALQSFDASDELAILDRGFLAVVVQQVFRTPINNDIKSRLGSAYDSMSLAAERARPRQAKIRSEFMSEEVSQKIKSANNNDLIAMTFYPAITGGEKIVSDALAAARFGMLTGLIAKHYAVLADLYGSEKVESWITQVTEKCTSNSSGIYLEFYELGIVNNLPSVRERSGHLLGETALSAMTVERPDVLYVIRLLLACRQLGIHGQWVRETEAKLLAKRETLGPIVDIYSALRDKDQNALTKRGLGGAVAVSDAAESLPVLNQLCAIQKMSLTNAHWENVRGMLRNDTKGGPKSLANQYSNSISLISFFYAQ